MESDSDSHYCAACHTTLSTLSGFLIHKLQHIGHGKGLGCELCGVGYNRITPLQDHYHRKHGLEVFAKRSLAKTAAALSREIHETPSATALTSSSTSASISASTSALTSASTSALTSASSSTSALTSASTSASTSAITSASSSTTALTSASTSTLTSASTSALTSTSTSALTSASARVTSALKSSTTTTSSALKQLLSTPFSDSCRAVCSLPSLPENIVYEEKLPSASRNLQSAKDKLTAVHFGLLSSKSKVTPAESKIKPAESLVLPEQRTVVSSDAASTDHGIELDAHDMHMSSEHSNLLTADVSQLLSSDTNLASAIVNLSSANINVTSPVTLSSSTNLKSSSFNLPVVSVNLPSINENLPSDNANPPSADVTLSSASVDLSSSATPISSDAQLSSSSCDHLTSGNHLSEEHPETASSEVNLCDVEAADLVTSDLIFGSHSVDMSSTAQLPSAMTTAVPGHLTTDRLTNMVETSIFERSDKRSPSKTIHVVIAKTRDDDIPVDEDSNCSLDKDVLEMAEAQPESKTASQHIGEDSSKNIQNKTDVDSDKQLELSNGKRSDKPDFHFILLANLVKGRVMSYRRNQFKCLHCRYKTTWINSLIKHMKTFHEDMMSIHEHIEVKSVDSSPDRKLVKMSTYTAELHSLKKTQHKRQRGVEKQDRLGEFSCKVCGKTFNRLRYLRKHAQVHRPDKKHLCDECGKSFRTRAYLVAHHRVHLAKEYRCGQCHFRSSINAVIHAHRQLHHDGSVLCDICGFAYNDRATLKKHKLVHDPARPHPCTFPGCTWRFKSEVMCLAHVRAHTSEGKFQCSLCSYVFRQNHHLQRHIATVHGIQKQIVKGKSKKSEQAEEPDDDNDSSSVRLILDYSQMDMTSFPSVLQNGQLVIATDSEGNTVNYEVADITMNVSVLQQDEESPTQPTDGQAVLIPNYDCGQIVFQGSELT